MANVDFGPNFYGDYSGMAIVGYPTDKLWLDRFEISDRIVDDIYAAMIERSHAIPKALADWNNAEGAFGTSKRCELTAEACAEFLEALTLLSRVDLSEESRECVLKLSEFLQELLVSGRRIFLEEL